MTWTETGLPWVPPSPNIPSLDSCYAYACTGLLQHTTVSEARGTCKPFEYFGAPWLKPESFVPALEGHRLPGVRFREVWFTPAFNKFKGELCGGVQVMFTDHRVFDPMRTVLTILRELRRLHPEDFHPTTGFGRWFDGSDWTDEQLDALDPDAFLSQINASGQAFAQQMSGLALYR
jgi:uncharacterized protein YbbC (DUF1343 family)